ncbi:hypothetical protein TPDSL_19440 [Terrisporobacter petrolearius]|uniref:ECF transporter S component n=1 Tax=Terrisporobacter petrolearius TaxID=1460447 RepID=UPI0033668383
MKTKKLILSGFFIACGIVLPMVFHMFSMGGPMFLPMHIPVLIAGYFLGPIYGAGVGIITPVLSGLLTGMPPLVPVMPIMAFELCGYGLVSGLVFSKTNKVYLSLIVAMIVGRLFAVAGAYVVALTLAPKINPIMYVVGGLTTAIPGMLIQLIFIPILIKILVNNKEISKAIA